MQLKSVRIANFRCIRAATIELGSPTAFVGGNGSGKSSILRAIDAFYAGSPNITNEDFYNRDTNEPIEIELTFGDFSEQERELFASKIEADRMMVSRIFDAGPRHGRYFGTSLVFPGFAAIRALSGVGRRTAYNDYVQQNPNARLERAGTVAMANDAMAAWEQLHPDQCVRERDDGQWFGFTNNANGKLQSATSFVFVPAVRDAAAEAGTGRSSAVSRLMDLVVKTAIESRAEIRAFRARISDEYRALMDPANLPELGGLASALSTTLRAFYANAAVDLQWQQIEDISAPPPSAAVALEEDNYRATVDRTGHGLQRAFVFALLQHLALATAQEVDRRAQASTEGDAAIAPVQTSEAGPVALPGLILAIEEPELYQHPTKQRHFAQVLSQLAAGTIPGVARQTQILFATHSPHFITMEQFAGVRLVRRAPVEEGLPRAAIVSHSTLSEACEAIRAAYDGRPEEYTSGAFLSRLHIMNPEVCEGFFTNIVVLVEGISDKAALIAAAALLNVDLEAKGVAVIPCGSTNNLDRPAAIFSSLGIPTYVIWDGDADKVGRANGIVRRNRALQRLVSLPETEISDTPHFVRANSACFPKNLEATLRSELGPAFDELVQEQRQRFEFEGRDDVLKVPACMTEVLKLANDRGTTSETLAAIINAIVELATAVAKEAGEVGPSAN